MSISGEFLRNFSDSLLENQVKYFLTISIFGLFFLVLMVFSITNSESTLIGHKPFIFLIFILICFLGIIAGIFPSKCLRIIQFEREVQNSTYYKSKIDERKEYQTKEDKSKENKGFEEKKRLKEYKRSKNDKRDETPIKFVGHHPDCGNFSSHIFQLHGKTYCAGCTGLVIGAAISILAAFMYLVNPSFLGENGVILFWLGFICVFLGLFQNLWTNLSWNILHLLLNLFFVLGAFFILIGIDIITGNFFVELYFLFLTIFWIFTRIVLAQRKHGKICASCGFESCSFS